ncbi:unnamed protein product, partial [Heterosigma akashiwo]
PTIGFASDAEKTCLGEISRRAAAAGGRGPVVVFPEVCLLGWGGVQTDQAVRTNGAAVLPFRPEVLGEPALPPAARAHLVLFNYRNAGFSPAHPVGPFLKKLFWICAQFSTPVTVNYITGLDTPKSSTAEKA